MRNSTNIERVVRIRRKIKENRYFDGKRIYKREQLELTIPSKFRDVIEPFLDKDLKVEAKREGNNLIIEAKPIERLGENIEYWHALTAFDIEKHKHAPTAFFSTPCVRKK